MHTSNNAINFFQREPSKRNVERWWAGSGIQDSVQESAYLEQTRWDPGSRTTVLFVFPYQGLDFQIFYVWTQHNYKMNFCCLKIQSK